MTLMPLLPRLFRDDVLWFEIAVDDSVRVEHVQAHDDGVGKLGLD